MIAHCWTDSGDVGGRREGIGNDFDAMLPCVAGNDSSEACSMFLLLEGSVGGGRFCCFSRLLTNVLAALRLSSSGCRSILCIDSPS